MTRPDLVADAQNLYLLEGIAWNRYDMLKRNRLPEARAFMELEWRIHPVDWNTLLLLINRQVGWSLFATFLVSTILLAPVGRIFGTGLFSPVTYPLAFFIAGIAGYCRFVRTASFREASWRFFLPQAFFIFCECSFSPGIDPKWVVIPVALCLLGLGYLADQVNTHYVWWITANLRLKREAVLLRRRLWGLRFKPIALSREISTLKQCASDLEGEGDQE
jgi:hypothetical protein